VTIKKYHAAKPLCLCLRALQDFFAQLEHLGVLQLVLEKLSHRMRSACAAPVCRALAEGVRSITRSCLVHLQYLTCQRDFKGLSRRLSTGTLLNHVVELQLENAALRLRDWTMTWNLTDLSNLPSLKRLQVEGFGISFEAVDDQHRAFAALAAQQVEELSLRYCVIDVQTLSLFSGVKVLRLHEVAIKSLGRRALAPDLNPVLLFSNTLQHLGLSGSALSNHYNSSTSTLKDLGDCRRLRELRLGDVTDLTEAALAGLPALTQLTLLHLHDAPQLVLTAGGPISRLQKLKCFTAEKIGGMDAQLSAAFEQLLNM